MLRQHGVDIKTAQELLRHANSQILLEIYQQAMSAEKRVAQNRVFSGLLEARPTRHHANLPRHGRIARMISRILSLWPYTPAAPSGGWASVTRASFLTA
jgi:hypothetical protein